MLNLVKHNSELPILYDLRRAAIVCIFQATCYAIYLIVILYYRFYDLLGYYPGSSFVSAMRNVTGLLKEPLYLIFIIIDAIIPMMFLRSYRNSFKRVFQFFLRLCGTTHGHHLSTIETMHRRSTGSIQLASFKITNSTQIHPQQMLK